MGPNGICRLIERKRALVTRTGVKAYMDMARRGKWQERAFP